MLVNLLYSFIPLQIILQIVVDRPVENPRKRTEKNGAERAEQILLAHARTKWLSVYSRDNLIVAMDDQLILTQIQVITKLYKVTTCIMTV